MLTITLLCTHEKTHWSLPHLIGPPSPPELSANKHVNIKRSYGCHNAVLLLSQQLIELSIS